MLFQKILALLLSLISGVASLFGVTMKDAYEPDAFPIISVKITKLRFQNVSVGFQEQCKRASLDKIISSYQLFST